MLVLVANLGSASFKFKLFEMDGQTGRELAGGSFDDIGHGDSPYKTHRDVIDAILRQMERPPDAIGFKAVHGGPISGAVLVSDQVLSTMEEFADVAPAHNPAYIEAMKAFRARLPKVPQVAAFETAFHQTIPPSRQLYAIPYAWTEELGIRRYGFHGASHQYIAVRMAELLPAAKRIISCHLGGSCSVCAINAGKSVANSFGMTLQSGLPHSTRVGEFDTFAIQKLLKHGITLGEIYDKLTRDGGLLGMSGVSGDMREIARAIAAGDARARLAVDAFVEAIRHYVGAYLVVLGGCDALVFTGGIGENDASLREAVCRNLGWAGIELDVNKNAVRGTEAKISRVESPAEIWVVPTNEEFIVARQTVAAVTEPTN